MSDYDNFKYSNYDNYDNYDSYHNNSYFIQTQTMTPFIGICFLLFLSICLSFIPTSRNVNITLTNELNTNLINTNLINELPIIIIKTIDKGVCSICLEQFIVNDKVNKLTCSHIFHKNCLDNWIQNNNCPLCRKNII